MRLSLNFVNVYTIAYRVQSTFTCLHARIPNGHPGEDSREEKRACRTSRRGSSCVSGSWQAERGSRGHADILATILAWKSARMSVSVSVSVSVPWNSSLTRQAASSRARPGGSYVYAVDLSSLIIDCGRLSTRPHAAHRFDFKTKPPVMIVVPQSHRRSAALR